MAQPKKENRSVRVSARIKPSLNKNAEKVLKTMLPKWSMSDLVEEALMRLVDEMQHGHALKKIS